MKYRKRIHYSDSQKSQMWERWRRGESLQQIAQLFATIRRFNGFLRKRAGFDPDSDTDPHEPLAWPSAKRSHVGSSAVVRSVQWPHRLDVPLPLSAVS
jgi:hypothetical protein